MKHLKYFFDRRIASGTVTLLIWLGALSFIILSIFSFVMTLVTAGSTDGPFSYIESFWTALAVAISPGLVTDPGWTNRIFIFLVAIFGIFVLSTLIGVLTSGITEKLYDLRRGRSLVLEEGHTLILGWSEKIAPIIAELVLANQSLSQAKVVVLADVDKIKMEEQLASDVGNTHTTEIICRNGRHTEIRDINIVNPSKAKSIIILKETQDSDDTETIKAILALQKLIQPNNTASIVTEITNPQNVEAALSIDPTISIVQPGELITRLIAQSARQRGLSQVYGEILSFDGNEIYFHHPKIQKSASFLEIVQRYKNAVPIGIYTDQEELILCPKHDRSIQETDKLIVIAEDDDKITFNNDNLDIDRISTINRPKSMRPPEHIWILGWHKLGQIFLEEFEALLPENSTISVILDDNYTTEMPQWDGTKRNFEFNTIVGDTSRKDIISLIDFNKCTHIIVMSYKDVLASERADNKTLLTIVHLRNLCKTYPEIAITSELINFRNKELISDTDEINDFVASEELVSQVLVQLAENPKLESLLTQILTADGPEFHVRKASEYPKTSTFEEISKVCLSFGEIAVGYRVNNRIIINPDKREIVNLKENDGIIVFAED